MSAPLFEVRGLDISVRVNKEWKRAVTGASFSVQEGEVLALVGESGAGKSLMAVGSVNLLSAGAQVDGGETYFAGHLLQRLDDADWRSLVGTGIGVIFQDPIASFDPLDQIGAQSGEVLEEHYQLTRAEIQERVLDALGEVKLPKRRGFQAYAHQMSRGQAQRAMLASALLSAPRLLIADEPVTGLDATVARAVLTLIDDMRKQRGMAMIMVTHDLGAVAGSADRVAVVYGGAIVEEGPVEQVFKAPLHPYTEGLLGSIPWVGVSRLRPIEGSAPLITDLPEGCVFAPRCPYVEDRCLAAMPPVDVIDGSRVRCRRARDLDLRGVGR